MNKIELFSATWCPHCINFKGEWNKLEKEPIETIQYDSDKDANKINERKITGFPTILLTKNGLSKKYVGERTAESILNEFNNMTGGGNYFEKYLKYKNRIETLMH